MRRSRSPARRGTREVGADAFFIGMFETALDPREVLTSIAFRGRAALRVREIPPSGVGLCGRRGGGQPDACRRPHRGGARRVHRRRRCRVPRARRRGGAARASRSAMRRRSMPPARCGRRHRARSDAFASAEYRAAMADVFVRRAIAAGAATPLKPLSVQASTDRREKQRIWQPISGVEKTSRGADAIASATSTGSRACSTKRVRNATTRSSTTSIRARSIAACSNAGASPRTISTQAIKTIDTDEGDPGVGEGARLRCAARNREHLGHRR